MINGAATVTVKLISVMESRLLFETESRPTHMISRSSQSENLYVILVYAIL